MKLTQVILSFILCFISFSLHSLDWKDDQMHSAFATLRQPWRPVQMKARNSVVQIFSQKAAVDILHPWAPPMQMGSRGSGFFISESGDILTNYHVVDQAAIVWIQIPALGKRPIMVDVIGVCPERDVALLRIPAQDLEMVLAHLGSITPLPLGNSDEVCRTDEVLALGYPLGQESLKSTTGIISGPAQQWIQMDAAINPGSSGGPLLNIHGEVIGINSAGVTEAQNVGYIIPINSVKVILADLYKEPFLLKPFLGVYAIKTTEYVTDYLGNPEPGGCYITKVIKNSPADKAGIKSGDMLYEINGYRFDIYGELSVPWSEDKISFVDYLSRLELGQEITILAYRNGEPLELSVSFDHSEQLPIRYVYPDYQELDYEIFAGMVVMELTLNHIAELRNYAPGLSRYNDIKNQQEPVLVITDIFSSSSLYRARTFTPGITLIEVNGQPVKTLQEFRDAIKQGVHEKYLVIKGSDTLTNICDNLLVALPYDLVLQEEVHLMQQYHYPASAMVKELFEIKGLLK